MVSQRLFPTLSEQEVIEREKKLRELSQRILEQADKLKAEIQLLRAQSPRLTQGPGRNSR